MENKIIRVAQGKHSTLSHLYIGGFCCYLLAAIGAVVSFAVTRALQRCRRR